MNAAATVPPSITGEELRARRLALGMTMQALAEALGIHWTTISRWERGRLEIENPNLLARAMRDLERNRRKKRPAAKVSELRARA
jgi:transcriptional regulator with XRE-family HTH domain